MRGKQYIFWFVLLSAVPSVAWGDELFVPSVGYETIQLAIESANPGDEIIVARGLYTENLNFRGKAITVRSEDPDDPNVVAATIIDGSEPTDPNFASVVIFNSGEGNDSVLTGFTITGGTGSWIVVSWEFKGERWNRCGGGVVCYNMSQPTITKNVFRGNSAGQGGGIYIYGDPVNPADPSEPSVRVRPVITENLFENNTAMVEHGYPPPNENYPANDHGDGGAIVSFQGVDAHIFDNMIHQNRADFYGGGIHLRQWSHGVIEQNRVLDNSSSLGAGIHITYESSPHVIENQIESNSATSLGGGGIYVYNLSHPIIRKNIIQFNTSSRGAGIGVYWDSQPIITHNWIVDNYTGAGILCVGTSPEIIHNTIVNNTASLSSGGVHCEFGASPLIEHNIISSNGKGYGIYVQESSSPSVPIIRYNNVWDHPLGGYGPAIEDQTGKNGNISVNADFVDISTQDYHLSVSSKCINAGDPAYIPESGSTDIDGEDRRMGQYIDLGADEAWPVWNRTRGRQYSGIQAAIDTANDGDHIVASQGRYYELVRFGMRQIVLTSADPEDWDVVEQTIIDANSLGTAVVITQGQDPNTVLAGFTITHGQATNGHGGGVLCYAAPLIRRNIICDNYSSYKGGGIYFWSHDAKAILEENHICDNRAVYGAGVFADTASSPIVQNNYIFQNHAMFNAGGVSCARNGTGLQLLRNWIVANTALTNSGGLHITEASPLVGGNIFVGNRAPQGSAIQAVLSEAQIVSNTFSGNRTSQGGAIYCGYEAAPVLANNLVVFSPVGYGMYGYDDPIHAANPTLSHNNVYGNPAGNYGGNLADPTGENGNISLDPNFVRPGYWEDNLTPADPNDDYYVPGNYHLTPGSASIDAGNNSFIPEILYYDFDGENRILADTVDMGTDEIDPAPHPADINQNGIVDVCDLMLFREGWLDPQREPRADLTGDNGVDLEDWAILAAEWLWQAYWYER